MDMIFHIKSQDFLFINLWTVLGNRLIDLSFVIECIISKNIITISFPVTKLHSNSYNNNNNSNNNMAII